MSYSPSSLLNPVDFDFGKPDIGAPVLYVVRHATVDGDVKGEMRGLLDEELNDKGVKEAQKLGEWFQDRPISRIVVDDLKRTKETGYAIAHGRGIDIETDLGLRSWDVGSELEGKPIEKNRHKIAELRTHTDKVPVGGQSWGDFKREALHTIQKWVNTGMRSNAPVLLVSHGSLIQLFADEYGWKPLELKYDSTPLAPAGVAALYLTRDGQEVKALRGEKASKDE